MTDQHLPDDLSIEDVGAAREWLRQMKQGGLHLEDHLTPAAIRVMEALLPSLTLADMTLDERDACAGMQADLAQGDRVVILDGTPDSDGLVQVLEKSLDVYSPHPDDVTPRPDLPRMEWPGEDPVPPDTLAVGSVWDDADALTLACRQSGRDQIAAIDCRGDVYVWGAGAEWWETGLPHYDFAPYAILHCGRKADQ